MKPGAGFESVIDCLRAALPSWRFWSMRPWKRVPELCDLCVSNVMWKAGFIVLTRLRPVGETGISTFLLESIMKTGVV